LPWSADDQHNGQSFRVLIILQDDRWPAAPLLAAIGGWKLDSVNIADDH
jgi:hypothetical protein